MNFWLLFPVMNNLGPRGVWYSNDGGLNWNEKGSFAVHTNQMGVI